MSVQITLADKLNTIASALCEIKEAARIQTITDPKERHAAMIQNNLNCTKIASSLRNQGSIDELFRNLFDQVAKFAIACNDQVHEATTTI
jgi:hypothetical protein